MFQRCLGKVTWFCTEVSEMLKLYGSSYNFLLRVYLMKKETPLPYLTSLHNQVSVAMLGTL